MAHIAGRTGIVFVASLLLDSCEADWDDGTNGSSDLSTTDFKVGSGSVYITGSSVVAGNVLADNQMTAAHDLSTYTHLLLWAKCNATLGADVLRITLDDDSDSASPEALCEIPALTADVWTYCHCAEIAGDPLNDAVAVEYIGLEWHGTAADKIVYLDDIRAAKTVAGMKSWTLDYTMDVLDTTDFANGADTNAPRTFIAGLSGWSGSFEGVKEGAPLALFSQVGLDLAESATATQAWIGNAILTGIHPNVSVDGVVTYTYDFQGVGELIEAST